MLSMLWAANFEAGIRSNQYGLHISSDLVQGSAFLPVPSVCVQCLMQSARPSSRLKCCTCCAQWWPCVPRTGAVWRAICSATTGWKCPASKSLDWTADHCANRTVLALHFHVLLWRSGAIPPSPALANSLKCGQEHLSLPAADEIL